MNKKVKFIDKQRVSIFLTPEKELELKTKALQAGISLSELVSIAASEYDPKKVVRGKELSDKQDVSEVFDRGFKLPVTEHSTGEFMDLDKTE